MLRNERNAAAQTLQRALDNEHEITDELRRRIRVHIDMAEGNYWAWQGDEEDHPESLTCPVLIGARPFKDLLDELERLRKHFKECLPAKGHHKVEDLYEAEEAMDRKGAQ